MSAVNVIIADDGERALMLTDTAAIDPKTGVFLHQASKAMTFPQTGMVAGVLGTTPYAASFFAHLSLYFHLDQFEQAGPAALRDWYEKTIARTPAEKVRFVVMGWSPSDKRFRALAGGSDTAKPFELTRAMRVAEPSIGQGYWGDIDADPEGALMRMMQEQRKFPTGRPECGGYNFGIGGLAVLTDLTEQGTSQKVIHRWKEDYPGHMLGVYADRSNDGRAEC
jgi:hypothetical protein